MDPTTKLNEIFALDASLRQAESELICAWDDHVEEVDLAIAKAIETAMPFDDEDHEAQLGVLASLCAQAPSANTVDALIRILDHESAHVRTGAGESLLELAYDRYAEVARGVERALTTPGHGLAMSELPWIIAEVAEPSAGPLIAKFLDLDDPDTIASAIEALAVMDDPKSARVVERFIDDDREVILDGHDEETATTLGELAREVVDHLQRDRG